VIAHAPTRREAAAKLARALQATRIQGITHNRDFLVATLRSEAFGAGDTTTDFIERVQPAARREPSRAELDFVAIGCALFARARRRAQARVQASVPGGFRNSSMPPQQLRYQAAGQTLSVSYRALRDGSCQSSVDGRDANARVLHHDDAGIDLAIDGRRGRLAITALGERWLVHGAPGDLELVELPRHPQPERAGLHGALVAPMPGKVLAVAVVDGDVVTAGQLLLVLEAMKMEHRITAPSDGRIESMKVSVGEQVANGAPLVEFDAT
jgi:propionyl-CoA carboxylase alpha chain